jgi:hypothetical protein
MLTEAQVKRYTKSYLDKKYKEVDSRERHEHGIDLKMRGRDNGRFVIIEAKGDSKAKSGMENKILSALGQTVARFKKHDNYSFGIAVPATWRRRLLGKVNKDAMRALHLVLFFVNENGKVIEVRSSSLTRAKNG